MKTKEYLELLCKDEFQKHYLEDGMNWAEKMLLSWLKLVVGQQTGKLDDYYVAIMLDLWEKMLSPRKNLKGVRG